METKTIDFNALPDDAHLREAHIVTKPGRPGVLPVSSATWWRWVKAGKAPKPVKLGEKVTAWRVGDLRAWMQSRAAA